MLETEDSQEYVWEIIDEIFDSTLNIIHNKYLESQKIPFNINEARKAILHIIDVISSFKSCSRTYQLISNIQFSGNS